MKRIVFYKILILLTIFYQHAYAQEICNNGIDDDNNGLIDCYDSQCTTDPNCSDFFYGEPVVNCSATPTNPAFSLRRIWQSGVDVSTRSTMLVGDVDADGVPEVVCHHENANELYILNGQNGSVEVTISSPAISDFADALALGDTDDDGLGEIYVIDQSAILYCYENDGTPKAGFVPVYTGASNESVPGIVDFNFDGIPEIYINNRIFNSLSGAFICAGAGSIGQNPGSNGSPASMPVAADVLPAGFCPDCSGIELVCGNRVYAVNIATGTVTAIANNLPASLQDGFTSVADMNADGQPDVVVVSNGTVYIWDPRTGSQIGNTFSIFNTTAGGRANIADYDNDGYPEIGVGGLDIYVCIDVNVVNGNLSQKWINSIVDNSQHTTGSAFDFDCDGKSQVVYRDENNLYVWDGATGNVQSVIQCGSATRSEFPTIADVDGDGQVNIVCSCSSTDGGKAGKVTTFNSSTNQWVNSRKVMNQHSYSVACINDDLSIPAHQQNTAILPKINTFLSQAPIYDVNWNSTCILLADVTIGIDSVIDCLKDDTVIVQLSLCNAGSNASASPLKISVYNGNPSGGGSLVGVFIINSTIQKGACIYATIEFPFTGTIGNFYLFANDNGTNPSSAPTETFSECDYSNNSNSLSVNMLEFNVPGGKMCLNQPVALDPGAVGDAYLWSTGDTSESTTITIPGTYTLQVTKSNCTKIKTIILTELDFDPRPDTNLVCPSVTVFHAGEGTHFLWSTGDTTESTIVNDSITIWYNKQVDYCLVYDTLIIKYLPRSAGLFIPNSFTPNGDELNEIYYLVGAADEEFEFMIFDRWGQMIFYSNNPSQGWNGNDPSGKPVPMGSYAWKLIYKNYCIDPTETKFGVVNVIR